MTCPPCHGECNQGRTCPARDEIGEPLTKEESIWVWSILLTFTVVPIAVITMIARHIL